MCRIIEGDIEGEIIWMIYKKLGIIFYRKKGFEKENLVLICVV